MITNKSNFEGAAKSLTSRYAELSRKSEEALALFQQEQYEEAYETMLDLARKSERATLISRKLPTHTGNPKADAEIDTVLEEACPIQMGFIMRDWFFLRMPPLAYCKDFANKEYIRGMLYPALLRFWIGKPIARIPNGVIVLRHVFAWDDRANRRRDYDNVETKLVVDAITLYLLEDDSPERCEVFHCTALGQEASLDVFVVPRNEFSYWYDGWKTDTELCMKNLRGTIPKCWQV